MKIDIYEFVDYKKYIRAVIQAQPARGHGFRAELAKATGCQRAFVSQVLKADAHFSLEQAIRLNSLLAHTQQEADYFLLIVHYTRAGSKELKDYYKQKIQKLREDRLNLKKRFQKAAEIDEVDQAQYYQAWYYAAAHILLGIPEYQEQEKLAKRLGLPLAKTVEILEFLCRCGLATQEKGLFKIGTRSIHLGSNSPLISKHHSNWRLQALKAMEQTNSQNMHYSSVASMAHKDVKKVKSVIVDALEKIRMIIKDSKEETIYSINIDLFEA